MNKPRLLWIACPCSEPDADLVGEAERHFDVVRGSLADALPLADRERPDVVVFDCVRPDQSRLRQIETLKRAHPSVPVLIMTLEHSEALAIWAFRAGLWNYLPKPVACDEFAANAATLASIARTRLRSARPMRLPRHELPRELPMHRVADAPPAVAPALAYIDLHFRERLREPELARLCNLSTSEFSREFHRTAGRTFVDHVTALRIAEARRLLSQPGVSVKDACFAAGFADQSYFARMFKRWVGETPSAWSRRHSAVSTAPAADEPAA